MASEVCKAYIRGALVTNWFWNKLLGHPHPWNQRWCLELWVNNHAPNITKVFSIIPAGLRDPESFRQSERSSGNRTETMHISLGYITDAGYHWPGHGVPATAPSTGQLLPPLPTSQSVGSSGCRDEPTVDCSPCLAPSKTGGESFGFVAWDDLCF